MLSARHVGAITVVALAATTLIGVGVTAPGHAAAAVAATDAQDLSPYYDMKVMARTPDAGLTAMGAGVSLNDKGMVAFTGTLPAGEGIFVTDGSAAPTNIASAFLSTIRTFGAATQINNNDQVLGRVRRQGPTVTYQLYRFQPGGSSNTQIATGGPSFSPVDVIGTHPTFNNSGATAFAGQCTFACPMPEGILTPKVEGSNNFSDYNSMTMPSIQLRPQMADTGHIAVKDESGGGRILLLDNALAAGTTTQIACATGCIHSGFTSVGRAPGIDDAGTVVTFVGDRGNGLGIFASVANAAGGRDLVAVTGERWDGAGACRPQAGPNDIDGIIGLDATGNPMCFKDFDVSSRIAVARQGGRLIVTFLGTPSTDSRPNPFVAGRPLLFSANRGIFTVDVEVTNQLRPPNSVAFIRRGPMKVAQVGDAVDGRTITALTTLHDPVTIPTTDDSGAARAAQPGDHRIAFHASTTGGDIVLRASHFDTDQDGLLDHWETAGLDSDSDGTSDLDLPGMGADPTRQDLFLEIDWLADSNNLMNGPISRRPEPGVTQALVDMFAIHGITLHVDAGDGNDRVGDPLSRNMSVALQGGDRIGTPGNPTVPPDIVIYDSPADPAAAVPGVVARSYDEIKRTFFGTTDKWAREFAFRYLLIADSPAYTDLIGGKTLGRSGQSAPLAGQVDIALNGGLPSLTMKSIVIPNDASGNPHKLVGSVVKITGACPAAGQFRTIMDNTATDLFIHRKWSRLPDSSCNFAVLSGSSGVAESFTRPAPDHNSLPGNDLQLTLASWNYAGIRPDRFIQWRTIAHEFGHNLGLRHCGDTPDQSACTAASYPSLMNYLHQLTRSSAVVDYSTGAGGSFNDWSHVRLDIATSPLYLGNAFLSAYGDENDDEPSVSEYVAANPGLDVTAPEATITSPAEGSVIGLGSTMVVDVTATDAVGVTTMSAAFDVDGDGTPESVPAVLDGGVYRATFVGVTGSTGPRLISALTEDAAGNLGLASATVEVVAASRATTTTITSTAPAPSVTGQPVAVRFVVAPATGSTTPTGNVTVSDGVTSCVATVGQGECTVLPESAGSHTYTASYAGDADFDASVSPGWSHLVNPAATSTRVIGDLPDPSAVGIAVTVTFAVTVESPGTGSPTGTVTVTDGGTSCTANLADGACPLTFDAAGPRTLTATYSGDDAFLPSGSPGEPHTVTTSDLPPTASVIDGSCASTPTGTLLLELADGNGDPVTATVLSNSDPELIPAEGITLENRGTVHALTVTAVKNRTGSAVITLGLHDGTATTPWPFTVIVGGTDTSTSGTPGVDMMLAQNGRGTLDGGEGSDLLCGGNGAETLLGGLGDDVLEGGNGADDLRGGSGNDALRGGNGPDLLTGGAGADNFQGGPGQDDATDYSPSEGDTKDATTP